MGACRTNLNRTNRRSRRKYQSFASASVICRRRRLAIPTALRSGPRIAGAPHPPCFATLARHPLPVNGERESTEPPNRVRDTWPTSPRGRQPQRLNDCSIDKNHIGALCGGREEMDDQNRSPLWTGFETDVLDQNTPKTVRRIPSTCGSPRTWHYGNV